MWQDLQASTRFTNVLRQHKALLDACTLTCSVAALDEPNE
jgi:hypothetical protein